MAKKLTPKKAYKELQGKYREFARLGDAMGILRKDAETQMPSGAAEKRSETLQTLSLILHEKSTDPRIGDLLDKAEEGRKKLSARDQRNLDLMTKEWAVDQATPAKLVEEQSRIGAEGSALHTQQHKTRTGDFKDVEAWLDRAFNVSREMGEIKKDVLGMNSVYDALLDSFSPGITSQTVEAQFAKLDKVLPDLIQQAVDKQKSEKPALSANGHYPVDKQMELCRWGLETIGFDSQRGRIDNIDGHPSCGGATNDVRLTTRLDPETFVETFKAAVHEGGHGMYELALPNGGEQPVDVNSGMAMHESQSMIIEYQACMTPEFISLLALKSQEIFGENPALEAGNLQKLIHAAGPSLIRVYADELTYPMHVSLRTEIEKAVIEGDMSVADMPSVWNEGMKKRLGIVPDNHIDGCMQDVHWFAGMAGYFPSYALGAMTAAQLFKAAEEANPSLREDIGQGNFTLLNEWLNTHVRGRASEVNADQLMIDATGQTLNSDIHIAHLKSRYLDEPSF